MASLKDSYTANELAQILGITVRAVQIRATEEAWEFQIGPGKGGPRLYVTSKLPNLRQDEIREALMEQLVSSLPEEGTAEKKARQLAGQEGLQEFTAIRRDRRELAEARAAIVRIFGEWSQLYPKGITTARAEFAVKYTEGEIEVEDWVRALVPSLHFNTLANWQKRFDTKGIAGLVDRRGDHVAGTGIIDRNPAMKEYIVGRIIKIYKDSSKRIHKDLKIKFKGQAVPSLRTLQDWVKRFKEENEAFLTYKQNPDGYKNKYMPAFGSYSANLTRPNQLWELDSSPTDILLADGTRYTLLACIDVFTRRCLFYLSKGSTAEAVCALLRKCLLQFGVPETIKTDNGSDYVSRQVQTVLHSLHIMQEFCTPFSPEQKPHVERLFGTFNHQLAVLPGFIGHCVADRKAIEGAKAFSKRIAKKDKEEEKKALEMNYTAEEMQAYCDQWALIDYGEEIHSTLGMSPNDAFDKAVREGFKVHAIKDERALDILLMPVAGRDGVRTVRSDGIHIGKQRFYAPIFGGMIGEEVRPVYDPNDAGYIYVYGLHGGFICRAEDPDFTGISRRDLALATKAEERKITAHYNKKARQATRGIDPRAIVAERNAALEEQHLEKEAKRATPVIVNTYTTPALQESGKAARVDDVPLTRELTPKQQAYRDKLLNSPQEQTVLTPEQLHAKYLICEEMIASGLPLEDGLAKWMRSYAGTSACKSMQLIIASNNEQVPALVARHLDTFRIELAPKEMALNA